MGAGVQIRKVLHAADCFVKVDPGQLEQVLLSLAMHAQDAISDGGILTIGSRCATFTDEDCQKWPQYKSGNFILLSVSESGSDASPPAKNAQSVAFFGSGRQAKANDLGMTVVHEFVRRNGGFTTVSRDAGCGSTFNIYLPLSQPPKATTPPETETGNCLDGTEMVLVVEDDLAVRATICRSLSRHGYRILEAGNGIEALRLASKHTGIHLVITDVVMPQMSGHQLAVELSALNPDLKIMFMSGYSEDTVFCKIVGEQNVAFLQKPFAAIDVAKCVRDLLDGTPRLSQETGKLAARAAPIVTSLTGPWANSHSSV